jgi:hypothetical protein
MQVELEVGEIELLISSLDHWKSEIAKENTPGQEAYIARLARLKPVEELAAKLRAVKQKA